MIRRLLVPAALAALMVLGAAGGATAAPDVEKIGATGAFWCPGPPALPAEHCMNVKSKGNTGLIIVTSDDERWPNEGVSTDPKSDARPCPHDPPADEHESAKHPHGTWWSPAEGLWVCHRRP